MAKMCQDWSKHVSHLEQVREECQIFQRVQGYSWPMTKPSIGTLMRSHLHNWIRPSLISFLFVFFFGIFTEMPTFTRAHIFHLGWLFAPTVAHSYGLCFLQHCKDLNYINGIPVCVTWTIVHHNLEIKIACIAKKCSVTILVSCSAGIHVLWHAFPCPILYSMTSVTQTCVHFFMPS